jgi:hypothetical protein
MIVFGEKDCLHLRGKIRGTGKMACQKMNALKYQ